MRRRPRDRRGVHPVKRQLPKRKGLAEPSRTTEALHRFSALGERDVLKFPAHNLVSNLMAVKRRQPISVLDVGGGRGELACCFAMMGTKVQVIEPHPRATG